MRERHVLSSAIKSRKAYDTLAPHVERDDFTEQGWVVWEGVSEYYGADGEADRIGLDPQLGTDTGRAVTRTTEARGEDHRRTQRANDPAHTVNAERIQRIVIGQLRLDHRDARAERRVPHVAQRGAALGCRS